MKDIDKKAKLIRDALILAEKKHKGQKRKLSGSPYIHHPLMVSYLAAHFKSSKSLHKLIAASLLHDLLEDTNIDPSSIAKSFGTDVASLVFELTDDKEEIEKVGKLEYQKAKWCGISSYALYLKLCDRLANVSDGPTEKYQQDTLEILKHLKRKRKLSKSQKLVIAEIECVISKE